MSGVSKSITVDACLQWLGAEAETIAKNPLRTLEPVGPKGQESWERADALLVDRLTGDDPLVLKGTLGQGGEGIVREAEQRSLGRMVAVKTLRGASPAPGAALSLLREAWLLGSLEHPNILPVHDIRRDPSGLPQVVLKRIEGTSWDEVIDDAVQTRERFGGELFEHNLEVLLQVCQAVRFAHSRGVVHRDLKPSNVMIGAFGEVYLLDWGIAVVVDEVAGLPLTPPDEGISGTPSYMAPEMLGVDGLRIDEATDVYLLGAVLFEICVGRPPHMGAETRHIVASILSSPPAIPDQVPADLAELIRATMNIDPAVRPSVDAFREGLLAHRRFQASNALASEASQRLVELEAVVSDPDGSLEEAYDRLGACRFGFQQSLETWEGNETAREGLRRAGCLIVRKEIARGDVEAARAQLDAIDAPPPELREEVEAAWSDHGEERERIAALERIGLQYDGDTGRAERMLVTIVLTSVWAIAPFVTLYLEHRGYRQRVPGVIGPVVYLALLGLVYRRYRRIILRTVFNRRTVAILAVALTAMLVFAGGATLLGLGRREMRILQLVLAGLVSAGAALGIDRRFWVSALVYIAGFLGSAAFADTVDLVLVIQSLCHGATAAVAFLMWRRPSRNLDERYGVGGSPPVSEPYAKSSDARRG